MSPACSAFQTCTPGSPRIGGKGGHPCCSRAFCQTGLADSQPRSQCHAACRAAHWRRHGWRAPLRTAAETRPFRDVQARNLRSPMAFRGSAPLRSRPAAEAGLPGPSIRRRLRFQPGCLSVSAAAPLQATSDSRAAPICLYPPCAGPAPPGEGGPRGRPGAVARGPLGLGAEDGRARFCRTRCEPADPEDRRSGGRHPCAARRRGAGRAEGRGRSGMRPAPRSPPVAGTGPLSAGGTQRHSR